MQNQKYNSGVFQNQSKQMHSSTFLDQYGIGRVNEVVITPTSPNGYIPNMKSSMMNNFEPKKFQNVGYESPRTSYSSQQSQQFSQVINGGMQQGKEFNPMAKTYLRKESTCDNNTDIWVYLKQMQKKITKITQTLYNHQQVLNQKSQWGDSRTSISSTSLNDITYDGFQREIANIVQHELEKELKKTQGSIFQQMERVKGEVRQQREIIKREQFEYFFKKLESETANLKREISKDFTQLRQNNILEKKNLHELLNKEFDGKINRFHQASRQAFKQIQLNFLDIKQILQALKAENLLLKLSLDQVGETNNQFFVSNKKFYDPKLIKYKQILEVGDNFNENYSNNKSTKQILINQVNYYIDREGFLLDKDFYYLLDKTGKQIQFKDKQLNILKIFNILH